MREPQESFFENLAATNKQDELRFRNTHRGRIEIIGDILAICLEGTALRTRIMYRANLSYPMLKEYTKELMEKGLLETYGSSYRTAEKGRVFLKYYEHVRKMLADETHHDAMATAVVSAGSKLLSLGVSAKFIKDAAISDDQARDLIKGILYLKEKLKEIPNGN